MIRINQGSPEITYNILRSNNNYWASLIDIYENSSPSIKNNTILLLSENFMYEGAGITNRNNTYSIIENNIIYTNQINSTSNWITELILWK